MNCGPNLTGKLGRKGKSESELICQSNKCASSVLVNQKLIKIL